MTTRYTILFWDILKTMHEMIKNLINLGYLKTPSIIETFKKIDRTDFVLPKYKNWTYENGPLPIGCGQTISQPLTVAFMLELLQPRTGDKILEIGSGSGWQSAMLAQIAGEKGKVFAIELIPELKEFGEKNSGKYNFKNLKFLAGNAEAGLPKEKPFDRIIAAASGKKIPEAWKEQLKIGGRMVLPVGNSIFLIEKNSEDEFKETEYPGFAFVPLII